MRVSAIVCGSTDLFCLIWEVRQAFVDVRVVGFILRGEQSYGFIGF